MTTVCLDRVNGFCTNFFGVALGEGGDLSHVSHVFFFLAVSCCSSSVFLCVLIDRCRSDHQFSSLISFEGVPAMTDTIAGEGHGRLSRRNQRRTEVRRSILEDC